MTLTALVAIALVPLATFVGFGLAALTQVRK